MTIDEFIEKWNVAYEDKEQETEFASEMRDDIISILSLINTKNKTGLDELRKKPHKSSVCGMNCVFF